MGDFGEHRIHWMKLVRSKRYGSYLAVSWDNVSVNTIHIQELSVADRMAWFLIASFSLAYGVSLKRKK